MDRTKAPLKTSNESRLVVAEHNQRRRPKRSSRACERCHRRKVRCDGAINGFPCTNCRLDQYPCTLQPNIRQPSGVKQLFKAPVRDPQRGTFPPARFRSSIGTIAKGSLLFDYPCLDASGLKRLTPETIVLLETHGCLRVPSRHALDALIKRYFLYVHPCLPVLDEAAFWREYRCTNAGGNGISIVLFRAMLFAASPFVPVEVAKQCGHETLLLARDDLYNRAKLLYESGAETDPLTIAQTTLLLSYYTTDSETSTNSTWLKIAIESAKEENAHLYYCVPSLSGKNSSDLKRIWWCCLIRDRLISLGMRRPIQITPDEYELPQQGLAFDDLEDEAFHSEVYGLDTKIALSQVLASLCHFVVTVTDMAMIVYPAVKSRQSDREDPREKIEKLEKAKSVLLQWELNWMAHMEGKDFYLHSSLALCSNLLSIYYQSARMAVSNHMCRLITMVKSLEYEDLKRIEACRSDLVTAIGSTAQKVKELIIHGVADKLPISAVAYTMLPQILLSIESELSKTPEDKQKREVMLVLFVEIYRIFSSRYYTRRILDITWRALQWCQKSSMSHAEPSRTGLALRADYSPVLFELRLSHYVRLLRYIDEVMSTLDNPVEKVSMLCPVDLALSDHAEKLGPSIPTWMQPTEETYFGQEALHSWSSSLFLSWQPADDASSASADSNESNEDVDLFQQILEYLPLLGE
ncbi:fungal-specific transcription factor domain-containing protein [Aspergillus floccosus]